MLMFLFGSLTMIFQPWSGLLFEDYVISVCFVFPWDPQGHAPCHCAGFYYSCTDLDGLCDNLRDVTSENIFNWYASATASKFYDWLLVEVILYKSTL